MPRRGNVPKRDVLPDPLYNSKLVTKLINNIMLELEKASLNLGSSITAEDRDTKPLSEQ